MALTASTLITDAELLAYPYVPYPDIPRPSLLRALGSLDAEVVRLLGAEVPHAVSCDATPLTIVLATNAAGYTLVGGFHYQQFTYKSAAGIYTPIEIVTLDREDDVAANHPAGIVVNQGKFLPLDPLGKRWTGSESRAWYIGDGDEIHSRRSTAPISPTTLASTLTSPNTARDYLLQALRLFIMLQHERTPEATIVLARGLVERERLMLLNQAHKNTKVASRFGEKTIGRHTSRFRRA